MSFNLIMTSPDDWLYRGQSCEAQLQAFDACGSTAGREVTARLTTTYHAAHNDYVLQLCAANTLHRQYHNSVLPATLKVCCVSRPIRTFCSIKRKCCMYENANTLFR